MILSLVKQRIGLMSQVRDDYIEARILASITSLTKEKGITIDETDMNLIMFIVDYTVWQYQSVGNVGAMPIDLRQRLNNILVKYTGGGGDDL